MGVHRARIDSLTPEERTFVTRYFQAYVSPVISPLVIDPRHPFPNLRNGALYLACGLDGVTDEESLLGLIEIPASMNRVVEIPSPTGTYSYILLEDVILACLDSCFGSYKPLDRALIRVTRNADIDVKEGMMDHDIDYREIMADLLKRRRKLAAVRLQVTPTAPQEILRLLCDKLELSHKRVFAQKSPLDLSFFYKLTGKMEAEGNPELFYPSARPMLPPQDYDLAAEVEKHDVLLSYPYQSIRPFIAMLKKAARDPEVISIKMTLYRMARESQIVQALIEAAENGKQVDVLVELKARFDEENNIEWSRRLERAGCHVIYGVDKLKVHSKLCLITRKTDEGIQYITQIGTGNYNEKTSRLYTDLSYITARDEIGEEALQVFQALMLGETVDHMSVLLVAPHCLQDKLIDMIDGEISKAKAGQKGLIRLKMNSLTDKMLIDKLVEASQAGVQVEMIVRGICCLRGGVPGLTDNVHIISIVGRFLEHSRIYIFGDGDAARYYIASADWMTRNTLRRVEVATPILQDDVKRRIDHIFDVMWHDNVQARDQQPAFFTIFHSLAINFLHFMAHKLNPFLCLFQFMYPFCKNQTVHFICSFTMQIMHKSPKFCVFLFSGIHIYNMCFVLKAIIGFFDMPVNMVNRKTIPKDVIPGNKNHIAFR